MSSSLDKSKIISAINETDDERILFAINRLLQIAEDIPEWHKPVLEQRLKDMEEGKAVFHNWEEIKSSLFASQ